jgi:hypothetical protein
MSVAATIDALGVGDLGGQMASSIDCRMVMRVDESAPPPEGRSGARRVGALGAREVRRLGPLGDSGLRRLSQPARISCSIGGSMLPPERITTVRPGGVEPFR